nr:molecular chaperone TorD family protein [Halovulum dunhuangense]
MSITLARPPGQAVLDRCAGLEGDATPLGEAVQALARIASSTSPRAAEREFNGLFIGLGRGEVLPYASYYMTGFLNEKPLSVLRNDMARLGITRAPNVFEPEDNIASLFEMMAGLILGRFGDPASLSAQRDFFNRHVGPWAEHMFSDLEGAKSSVFYAAVGRIGRTFVGIEKEAFRMMAEATA